MGIVVATRAGQIFPVVDHCRLGLKFRRLLMALGAWSRNMTTRKSEVRLLVFVQCERGRLVSFQIMTAVAPIEVGRRGKLSGMLIAVAVDTALKLHLE